MHAKSRATRGEGKRTYQIQSYDPSSVVFSYYTSTSGQACNTRLRILRLFYDMEVMCGGMKRWPCSTLRGKIEVLTNSQFIPSVC